MTDVFLHRLHPHRIVSTCQPGARTGSPKKLHNDEREQRANIRGQSTGFIYARNRRSEDPFDLPECLLRDVCVPPIRSLESVEVADERLTVGCTGANLAGFPVEDHQAATALAWGAELAQVAGGNVVLTTRPGS